MNERGIDFNNVDKAFQSIASSAAGKKALSELETAMQSINHNAGVSLTDYELKYIVASLAKQYKVQAASPRAQSVGSFVIKTAVDAE